AGHAGALFQEPITQVEGEIAPAAQAFVAAGDQRVFDVDLVKVTVRLREAERQVIVDGVRDAFGQEPFVDEAVDVAAGREVDGETFVRADAVPLAVLDGEGVDPAVVFRRRFLSGIYVECLIGRRFFDGGAILRAFVTAAQVAQRAAGGETGNAAGFRGIEVCAAKIAAIRRDGAQQSRQRLQETKEHGYTEAFFYSRLLARMAWRRIDI